MNPLRLDPTRTTLLRRAFAADMHRRMMAIRRSVVQLIEVEDAFGLARNGLFTIPTTTPAAITANVRWQFATDDKKVAAYQEWLKGQVDQKLLTVDPANKDTPWLQKYIGRAYEKGKQRAYIDAAKHKGEPMAFVEGGKEAFLKRSFESPIAQSKLRSLATRAFTELKGIGPEMDKQMTRVLVDGLAKGKNPKELARELAKTVDGLDKKRAQVIARTEIVRAHNEGQLDTFAEMNVEGVGVKAEWSTAGDGKVCPLCAPMEGKVFTIEEARGHLPRHPNCRCAWIPAAQFDEAAPAPQPTEGPAQPTEDIQAAREEIQARPKAGFADSVAHGLPSEDITFPVTAAQIQTAPIKSFNIADLIATQDAVRRTKLLGILDATAAGEKVGTELDMPSVIKSGDKYYLWDGHHRTEVARVLGKKKIKGRFVNLDTSKK